MLRRCLLATIGLLAFAGAAKAQTAAQPPAPAAQATSSQETMEEPEIGDHWTYEVRDEITGDLKSTITHTITDISPTEIGIRLAVLGKSDLGFQSYDRAWDMITNGIWRSTPNDGMGIRAPLAVGKSWPVKATDFNSSNGISLKRTGTAKVTAQESLTTRAGTFETYKIEIAIESRNANDTTKKYLSEQQIWYAPSINHWVKRASVSRSDGRVRDRSMAELVEYGRR
ncbi:hypothetical protein QA645_02140 [Bradyrhizobium sp. CIAT3101]|uniref:hypothetical protein n=1 Tax=Bradyrhizobium sp. CIAT3101 TaxID=439387 RepID=UPI0024B10EFA|nr:hypothetical protein [Bradyrhizobium sp. CIAT3101]WFU81568.1 hypothetical protein QA645_02140 [Bradyrhizobium sp. CIAT3101]